MDMIYEDYIDFINHLFMQQMLDFSYRFTTGSTSDSLTIL